MAGHQGQVKVESQAGRSRSRGNSAPNAASKVRTGSERGGAFALQRTLGNRALAPRAAESAGGLRGDAFVNSLLQRTATIRPVFRSTATLQRDPFFRSAPRITTGASPATLQRFKDTLDGDEVTEEMIEKAPVEKLKEWLTRPEYDFSSDDPDVDTWPDPSDRILIQKRLDAIGQAEVEKVKDEKEKQRQEALAKERQEMLLRLGVSDAEYVEITRTTNVEKLISDVSKWCSKKTITVTSALDAIKGYSQEKRLMALEVMAKGKVDSLGLVTDMCDNWAALDERDSLDIDLLVRLLNGAAMTAGGGTYRVPTLTGTKDMAIPFLSNGTVPRRIDPEFHVHYNAKTGASNPGFKKSAHKKKIGPGTRREVSSADCTRILKASGLLK